MVVVVAVVGKSSSSIVGMEEGPGDPIGGPSGGSGGLGGLGGAAGMAAAGMQRGSRHGSSSVQRGSRLGHQAWQQCAVGAAGMAAAGMEGSVKQGERAGITL